MLIIYLGDFSNKILKILNKNKVSYKQIGELDLNETLEQCFTEQKSVTGKGNCYVCSSQKEEAFQVVQLLKQAGIQGVRLSVETEFNKKWKICDWMKELDAEYDYFSTRDLLKQMLQKAENKKNKNMNQGLSFIKADQIYKNGEASIEELKQAVSLMKQAFK